MALRKASTVYNINTVLAVTLKVLEDRGEYVSKKVATTSGAIPTSEFVLQYLNQNQQDQGYQDHLKNTYRDKINEIVKHFSVITPQNVNDDFLSTVFRLLSTDMVSDRMIAFIVALPWMYENLHDRVSKLMQIAEKYANSNYIGEIGVRDNFIMKCLDVQEYKRKDETTGEDNIFYIYRIVDRIGNYGFFFSEYPPAKNMTSSLEHLIIDVWDCFEMRANPKKMEPNRETGIKETQFNRVTITEFIGPGTEE